MFLEILVTIVIGVFGFFLYKILKEQDKHEDESLDIKMRQALERIQVNERDAAEVQQVLDQFTEWKENFDFTHLKGMPVNRLKEYLDKFFESYEDKEGNQQHKPNIIYAQEGVTEIKSGILKATCKPDTQGASYVLMAFTKSFDGKFADCMILVYSMEFKLGEGTTPPIFLRLWKWLFSGDVRRVLTTDEIEKFENFFLYKAVLAYQKRGLISRISHNEHQD